jgi:hypothetical protein
MRVFVLNAGRSGSVTFSEACKQITNYTAGHETRMHHVEDRFGYPDQHIEVDNRLSFFLGELGDHFPDDVFYVHLLRDPEAVARSFFHRWTKLGLKQVVPMARRAVRRPYARGNTLISAFGDGVIWNGPSWNDDAQRLAACRRYVAMTTANIRRFLRSEPHVVIQIEEAAAAFPGFCDRIGGSVLDMDAAIDKLAVRHNRTPEG